MEFDGITELTGEITAMRGSVRNIMFMDETDKGENDG